MIKRLLSKAGLPLLIFAILPCIAGAQETRPHFITVNSTGSVLARPNLGILTMAVQSAIEGMGYSSKSFKFTPVVLSPAGGPYYAPGRSSIAGIAASQFIHVFFEGAELKDEAELSRKSAAVIDAVIKAGAVPNVGPIRSLSQPQGSLIVFTIKDPANQETRALEEAMTDARVKAQGIASRLHVQITGLASINSFVRSYPQQPRGLLEDLPYRYYSTESGSVKITEAVTLAYSFK